MTESSESRSADSLLCRIEDVPDGGVRELSRQIAGEQASLLVLRRGARVEVFLNVCPHAGRPLNWAPGRFLVEQGLLICAAHGASFEIPDGLCIGGPCRGSRLQPVPTRLHEGELHLAVST